MFYVGFEFFLGAGELAVEEEVGREGEPFVFEAGAGGDPASGVDDEHVLDEVFGFVGDVAEDGMTHGVVALREGGREG